MADDKARTQRRKKALRGAAAGLASAALALLLNSTGALQVLEWKTWDVRLKLTAEPRRASSDIVLLAVDQASLDYFEKEQGLGWPWPRQLYAGLLDFLKAGAAKAVFFDITMTESSTFGVEDDQLLAEAMARTGNVVLPVFLSPDEKESDPGAREMLAGGALEGRWAAIRPAGRPAARSVSLPVDTLAAAAARLGDVHFVPDGDSVYRRLPLAAEYDGLTLASLPLALADLLGAAPDPAEVPLDRSGAMIIRFHGPDQTYRTYSIAALINSQARIEEGLSPQVDPAEFAGKTVLIGATAAGLLDFRPTPFGGAYPGMEILATALDNLVHRDFVREAPAAATWIAALVLALAAGVGTSLLRRTGSMAAIGLAAPAAAAAGAVLAARSGLWVELVAPAAAAIGAFVIAALLSYGLEGRQRRFIKNAFHHYLSPHVIDRVLDDPTLLRLGGERREITAFFSDLAGFTSISEHISPEALVGLLNAYLSDMTDIILDLGGTLDKYEGDAIIAFWNAPVDLPDHALRGCRAALRCQKRLAERREEFRHVYGHELRMRIGLNSGPAVVGNMGSERRFDYTAMGDTMNLASRLEGAGKIYGTWTLIGEETERLVRGAVVAREVDLLRVVGKARPVRIFELLGEAGEVPAEDLERLTLFGRALGDYRARRFDGAAAAFSALAGDPVASLYAERARRAAAVPPPADWDGGHTLDRK